MRDCVKVGRRGSPVEARELPVGMQELLRERAEWCRRLMRCLVVAFGLSMGGQLAGQDHAPSGAEDSNLEDTGSDVTRRLMEAERLLQAGSFDAAEARYRAILVDEPQRVAAHLGLAEVFAAQDEGPRAASFLVDLGNGLARAGRFVDATTAFERAVELRPTDASLLALFGRSLAESRQYQAAAATLGRALELGEDALVTHLYHAAALWESERLEASETAYRRTLKRHGKVFATLYQFGQFLSWRGRHTEAVALLEQAAEQRPDRADVHHELARALAAAGRSAAAVTSYRRALELAPELAEAYYGLAMALGRLGQHAARQHALETFSQLDGRARESELSRARERQGWQVLRRDDDEIAVPPATEAWESICPVNLVDLAPRAGLHFLHDAGASEARHLPETMGSGLAWLDYDGDGWHDLYLVQSGAYPPDGAPRATNRLFRNLGPSANGEPRFADVTDSSGAGDRSYGQGVAAADVDGDGDVDLYVSNVGRDTLLENRGDGRFIDATERAGLGEGGWSSSSAFGDLDGDGDLDLYVARYLEYTPEHGYFCGDLGSGRRDYCNVTLFPGAADQLYRNLGGGRFEELAQAPVAVGKGLGVIWGDLGGDVRGEVYIANDMTPNFLLQHTPGDAELKDTELGAGVPDDVGRESVMLEDVALLSGAALNASGEAEAGMGIAMGDVDGDGDADLGVTHFDVETNTLYLNRAELGHVGGPQLEDVSAASGFGVPSFNRVGFGIVWADLDLDGDLDAYITNGHVFLAPRRQGVERAQLDLVLLGDGQGGFEELPCAIPGSRVVGRGLAAADLDRDGDPDLAAQSNGGAARLLVNRAMPRAGRWLAVELRGQAVGARIEVEVAGRRQTRWILAGESYQSSSAPQALFALPGEGADVEIEVRWPSGRSRRILGARPGRSLRLAPEPQLR